MVSRDCHGPTRLVLVLAREGVLCLEWLRPCKTYRTFQRSHPVSLFPPEAHVGKFGGTGHYSQSISEDWISNQGPFPRAGWGFSCVSWVVWGKVVFVSLHFKAQGGVHDRRRVDVLSLRCRTCPWSLRLEIFRVHGICREIQSMQAEGHTLEILRVLSGLSFRICSFELQRPLSPHGGFLLACVGSSGVIDSQILTSLKNYLQITFKVFLSLSYSQKIWFGCSGIRPRNS